MTTNTELARAQIRAAGGIVHSDGNIFFTSIAQLDAYTQAIAAQAVQAVPRWQLVPVVPTNEMIATGEKHTEGYYSGDDDLLKAWNAMLDAAPQPPAKQVALTRDEVFDLPSCGINDGSQVWLFGFANTIAAAYGIHPAATPEKGGV